MDLQLEQNIFENYVQPNVYLCDTGKNIMGQIQDVTDLKCSLKWNSYSEISFNLYRKFTNIVSGEYEINPYYDYIETPRFLKLEGFGYFIIQSSDVTIDENGEFKAVTAYSLEYDLSSKYLDNFYINTGEVGDVGIDDEDKLHHIVFYNPNVPEYSLLHLILKNASHWNIGHVDADLATQQRTFSVDRENVYDFLMNQVAPTLHCVFVFDTYNNLINCYDEDAAGYDTDIVVSMDNLAKNMDVKFSADDIKTMLKVTGAEDLGINSVNLGNDYLLNLDYYNTVDWLGRDLYNAYNNYLTVVANNRDAYKNNLQSIYLKYNYIQELNNKVSTVYQEALYNGTSVSSTNFSKEETYYKRIGSYPDYVYVVVDIATEYISTETYYVISARLTENKLELLRDALNDWYNNQDTTALKNLSTDFSWLASYATMLNKVSESSIQTMLSDMWKEYGLNTLLFWEASYKEVQQAQIDQGISKSSHTNYYLYLSNYTLLQSVQTAINDCKNDVANVQQEITTLQSTLSNIADITSIHNNFTDEQYKQLLPFLKEDEYSDDCFVITDYDNDAQIMDIQEQLLEAGAKELDNISKPKLQFTMDMANIYATPEFQIILQQFALGNMVRIELRPDYIKKVRLLEIDFNFNELDDFSVTFGELYAVKDVTDIHADLLKQAASAGKSVANSKSYWQKGYDRATITDQRIKEGLINATTSLHSPSNSGQDLSWDTYGIHLRKYDEDGKLSQYEGWLTNNNLVWSDDNFKSSKALFGKFTVDGVEKYGVLSEAVLSGYIEGSLVAGGMIQSTAENTAGNPVTWINLNDGTFSFANGSLTWGENGLKIAGYDSTDLATKSSLAAGTTIIDGGCLTTGIIKSNVNATTGNPVSQINLQDGTFSFANGNLTYDGTTLNIQGTLSSSIINGGTINGTSIYGGQIGIGSNGDGYNFYVDTDGNLTLNGNINMADASNINWGENAPVKYQFSTNGSSGWHDTMSSRDMYRRDSLDGGATWGDAYQFRGRDGSDGSDADVPDYIRSTYIDSTIIKSPTIEANEVNMYGGIFSLYNWDGSSATKQGYIGLATGMDGDGNETQGVSMSAQTVGSIEWYDGFPFFVVDTDVGSVTVTNAGARLNCGDNEICVTANGATVKVNGTRYSLANSGAAVFG